MLTHQRSVVWKNVCMIGEERRECIVEMSYTKLKFYIVALDMQSNKCHVVELWRVQADKVIKACGNSFNSLMQHLEFMYGSLQIKDMELLLQY